MNTDVQIPVLVPASGPDSKYRVVAEDFSITVLFVTIKIKSGFVTDGASVPALLQRWAGKPFDFPRVIAAVIHDWLYSSHVVSRLTSDILFLSCLIKVGYPVWRSLADFWAVRRFGQSAWDSHRDQVQINFARSRGSITPRERK